MAIHMEFESNPNMAVNKSCPSGLLAQIPRMLLTTWTIYAINYLIFECSSVAKNQKLEKNVLAPLEISS